MAASLRNILLFVRSPPHAARFYQEGLQLPLTRCSEEMAELSAGDVSITLKAVLGNEAILSTGYSPFLNFVVADFDSALARMVQLGAHMDGPVLYPTTGKFAALRSPDGHMLGLHEPAEG